MKCFNCGNDTNNYLCENCHTEKILDTIYNEILSFKDNNSNNKYIQEYDNSLENVYKLWDCIPNILQTFDEKISEYYLCHYYKITRNLKFEDMAINYLNSHELNEYNTQRTLYDLLNFYLRNEFIKPKKWCDLIEKRNDNYAIELYSISAEFYSMIAEYDLSKKMIDKGRMLLKENPIFIYSDEESATMYFNKLDDLLKRYKSGKPYWPSTEERRKAIAEIYDQKGINHPRLTLKPTTIKESEFRPIKEVYENIPDNYVCFWCAETYNTPKIKCIYQIGAIKVKKNKIVDEYQSFVKPWDGMIAKKRAASEANVELSVIESAKDVDIVMKEFLNFIQDDILISTDALGNQAKLFTRALRYAGVKSIENGFFDILDYASDVNSIFDLDNNNRDFLIKYFDITEGKDSLDKAKVNFEILKKLKEWEH